MPMSSRDVRGDPEGVVAEGVRDAPVGADRCHRAEGDEHVAGALAERGGARRAPGEHDEQCAGEREHHEGGVAAGRGHGWDVLSCGEDQHEHRDEEEAECCALLRDGLHAPPLVQRRGCRRGRGSVRRAGGGHLGHPRDPRTPEWAGDHRDDASDERDRHADERHRHERRAGVWAAARCTSVATVEASTRAASAPTIATRSSAVVCVFPLLAATSRAGPRAQSRSTRPEVRERTCRAADRPPPRHRGARNAAGTDGSRYVNRHHTRCLDGPRSGCVHPQLIPPTACAPRSGARPVGWRQAPRSISSMR